MRGVFAFVGVLVAAGELCAALKPMVPAEKLPDVKIYVSPSGKDSNPGTLSKPFKTVQKAIEAARTVGLETDAPRTIVLADGTYPVEDEAIKVGSKDYALTIRAANRGKAVISGFVPVTGWEPDPTDPSLLVAPLPVKPEEGRLYMLVSGGKLCDFSTYPAIGQRTLPYRATKGDGNWTVINYVPEALPADFSVKDMDLASVWLMIPQEWATSRSYLSENDVEGHRFVLKSKAGMELGQFNQGYRLMNTRLGLKEPGTWMFEAGHGRILYHPREGEDAKTLQCVLTRARCLLEVNNVRSLTIDGIVFEGCHGGFGGALWTAEPLNAALSVKCSRRVTLRNCEIRNTAAAGVMFLKADTCRVQKCDIHHVGASCVDFEDGGVGNVEVSGCELHHGGVFSTSALLYLQIVRAHTIGNHIHHGPGNGAVMWSGESVFASNHIHHVMLVQRDGGGLYGAYNWTLVKDNHVHDTGGWPCLYADEGSQHTDFVGNRCEHWWPTHMHCTRFCSVSNNVFTCPGDHRFSFQGSGGGRFTDNKLILRRDVKKTDYLSLEACVEWARTDVWLIDPAGGKPTHLGLRAFPCGAHDPDPLFVPRGAESKPIYPSQLAEGGSICGCPYTQVRASHDGVNLTFRLVTTYNAFGGYFACRNLGGRNWRHWDSTRLVFGNGLIVDVFADGFAKSSDPNLPLGKLAHESDYRNERCTVSIPISALGIEGDPTGKSIGFNVCCHNEDHRVSTWGWHPKGKSALTGELEFR